MTGLGSAQVSRSKAPRRILPASPPRIPVWFVLPPARPSAHPAVMSSSTICNLAIWLPPWTTAHKASRGSASGILRIQNFSKTTACILCLSKRCAGRGTRSAGVAPTRHAAGSASFWPGRTPAQNHTGCSRGKGQAARDFCPSYVQSTPDHFRERQSVLGFAKALML